MKIAVTGKGGVERLIWQENPLNITWKNIFSDNFPLAFSAEEIAYVGDIVIDYMKKVWEQVKEWVFFQDVRMHEIWFQS